MEKIFLLYLSVHWGDLMEQIIQICHIHFKENCYVLNVNKMDVSLVNDGTGKSKHGC